MESGEGEFVNPTYLNLVMVDLAGIHRIRIGRPSDLIIRGHPVSCGVAPGWYGLRLQRSIG